MSGTLLVTGSSGLIGSTAVEYFAKRGWRVCGIDNNQREVFFGKAGSTRFIQRTLERNLPSFTHYEIDIRDRKEIVKCMQEIRPDAIIHAAAQPSHDYSGAHPLEDFDINAVGTLNLLEAMRQTCPASAFVFLSSSKVYGDRVNAIPLRELPTRWECDDARFAQGIAEDFGLDQTTHSPYGADKAAADLLVQEYGRYYGLHTCCLRCNCLAGPHHAGVELHGFLSFLTYCNLEGKNYTVFGHKGKQVRDNIHAVDVIRFIELFFERPLPGAVYNIGGGREQSCSILEAFEMVASITGTPMRYTVVDSPRRADHIWYITNVSKAKKDFPEWSLSKPLRAICEEIVQEWRERMESGKKVRRLCVVKS